MEFDAYLYHVLLESVRSGRSASAQQARREDAATERKDDRHAQVPVITQARGAMDLNPKDDQSRMRMRAPRAALKERGQCRCPRRGIVSFKSARNLSGDAYMERSHTGSCSVCMAGRQFKPCHLSTDWTCAGPVL